MNATDAELDRVYDMFDLYFQKGNFDYADQMLSIMVNNIHDHSTDVLIAFLTATLPAKEQLKNRPAFFNVVERTLRSRDEWEDTLLDGLR